jgi:signal transduction histidine kinase
MARIFEKLRWLRWRRASSFIVATLVFWSPNRDAISSHTSSAPAAKWFLFSEPEALKGQRVEFQGTVLCYDSGWGQFYVHDGSDAIYISPRRFTNHFEVGQVVAIKGKTTWDETGSTLTNGAATVIGNGLLPPPVALKLPEMAKYYGQWIEICGQVRVAEASRGRVALVLKDGDQECLVYVLQTSTATPFKNFVDASVRIQGINGSRVENGRLAAATLFSPGMSQVKVINTSRNDRWQLPVKPTDALLAQPLGDWTNQPVHVNGLVTTYKPGSYVTITDATGALKAEIIQMNPALLPSQRIDVWGFLSTKSNQPFLADAYFEVGVESPKKAAPIEQAKQDTKNGPVLTNREELVLTNIGQIRSLPKEKANAHLKARIRGVLTCVDLEWHNVFLQAGHDAIFLDTGQAGLQAGQWVEVAGQTDAGGFAPQLINCTAQVLGTTNLPVAAKIDLQDVASGHLDSQWAELEGVVRQVSKENGRISLTLAGSNGKFTAIVRDSNDQPAPTELVDSYISIRGACGSTVNSRGQISGVTLHVPSREEITIIDPSPADPFAIAPTPISNVATYNAEKMPGRRIKVAGIVTLVAPDKTLFIQDESGGMRIKGVQLEVHAGEQIEAIGFPAFSEFSPRLDASVVRKTGAASLPGAKVTTAAQILQNGKFDGSMVELRGNLLQDLSAAQPKLVLQDGPVLFTAQIAHPGFHESMPSLGAGSEVSVRGVCVIQGGENNEPATFHVLLADTTGIALKKGVAWWTLRHSMMLLGGVFLGALLVSVWVQSLRRQVRLQTEIIQQNQEKLITASRQAGMAEVATSVLHNVGNVLNSINVSANLVDERVKKSRIADVRRLANLLEEHAKDRIAFLTTDPKGQTVPDYICRLAKILDFEQIAMQQSYAKVSGMFENIEVAELLEDTLRMDAGSLARHHIKVVRDFTVLPSIYTDKHKALQILMNLVRNAKHACEESGKTDKQVILRVTSGEGRVQISVIDNGIGIPPENLTRIFSHGFTTRKDGHGFGLHSGALAAKELGGSLAASSPGPGLGAAFTLELPCRPPANDTPEIIQDRKHNPAALKAGLAEMASPPMA